MLREFSAEIPCRSHLWGLAFLRTKKSLNPIGNADEGKKSSFAGDGLKKKVCPSWESDKKQVSQLNKSIMHAKVYQITKHRVDKENYLNENTLTQGDSSDYDYCSEISEEERAESIDTLVNQILPKGMFTLVGSDELVFNGGNYEWIHKWVDAIHKKSDEVTADNVTHWIGAAYQLQKVINNPLGTDSHFYLSESTTQTFAEPSAELMRMVCKLRKGERLYIGGIIDYHF